MRRPAPDTSGLIDLLLDMQRNAPGPEEKAAMLAELRQDAASSLEIDLKLLDRLLHMQRGLLAAKEQHARLETVLENLSASPWLPATFLGIVATPKAPRALVRQGHSDRVVAIADTVEMDSLKLGDRVFLARELNVVMARAPTELAQCGEVCTFERLTGDGRLVVKSHSDEQFIVRASSALAGAEIKPGTRLRWDREAMLAFERLESSHTSAHFLESTPPETFADIGGLGPQIARITRTLALHFEHRDVAGRYGMPPVGSILLWGPPGTGKTLVAKAIANWFAQFSPARRSFFMNVKPSALGSMWHSESERNIRELFRVAADTAAAHPGARVLIFFDELDSIGGTRGASHMQIHDHVLEALLTELDGFKARTNVVVVGATNRRDALDPALLRPGRFGDLELELPRPDRNAAREIFGKHLAPVIPYARNGHGDDFASTRLEIIEAAASTIYAPNGGGDLATLTFRDGKRRPVRAADLVSGAVIASIARDAVERACRREIESGAGGLRWDDVAQAIEKRFESAAHVLTPANCRQHLSGLPHDLDVVNVELPPRKIARPQRFLNSPGATSVVAAS